MKKIVSLILTFLLVLPFANTPAHALGKPELKFRDVKLGITYKEAMPLLKGSGLEEVSTKNIEDEFHYEITFSDVEVANYSMTPIVYFRWKDNKNSTLEDSIFVSAEYKYKIEIAKGEDYTREVTKGVYQTMNTSKDQLGRIRRDLAEKLSSLYGDYKFDNNETEVNGIKLYMEDLTWSKFKDKSEVILWANLSSSPLYDNDKLSYIIEYVNNKEQKILDKMLENSKPAPNSNGL